VSNAITIQTQDSSGNPANMTTASTIVLTSTSANGKFYSDYNGLTLITSVTITTGTNSALFYYKDSTVATPTVTAHQSAGTPAVSNGTQIETIRAAKTFPVSTSINWSAISLGPPLMGDTVIVTGGKTLTVDVVNAAAGTVTLNTSGQTNTLAFNNGTTLTVNTFTLGGSGTSIGVVNMTNGGLLIIKTSLTKGASGTLTAGTGTVAYNGSAAQTVTALTYNNLIIAGSGVKSMAAANIISGNLSITNPATVSIAASATINVNTLTLGGVQQVPGTWGSTSSTATNKTNTYFAATTGKLSVSH
jgi:hypothetical protein